MGLARERSFGVKVCVLTETFHPVVGGGETQARLLAEGLQACGHEALVVTRRTHESLASQERVGRIPVHRVGPVGSGQLRKWGLVCSALPALLRLRNHYDLIFVSGFRILGIPAVLASRLLGRPVVLKADSSGEMSGEFFSAGLRRHGLTMRSWPVRAFIALRNTILRRAQTHVAISSAVASELAEAKVPPPVHRIPNAVDTARFYPASGSRYELRERLGLPVDATIFTYAGRLVSYKGLPLLLRVWERLSHTHPQARLVLLGTGGLDMHACEEQLRAFVSANALADRVVFTGSVDNVDDYLRASDAFVFPTENDVFPSALIEAMTTRLPVIATPVGAIPEIVRHEFNGLLVRPGDDGELFIAMERLLDDPALAARLAQAAWQTVQERYTAQRVTQAYVALFAQLLHRASPERARP
jgi:glycosyltransferase involved in cell wall biosynthesis